MITIWKDPESDYYHVQKDGMTISMWSTLELAEAAAMMAQGGK